MSYALMIFVALIVFVAKPGNASIAALNMVGKGEIYYLGFIKVYDAALYVDTGNGSQALIDSKTSRCLKLTYDVSLGVKDFVLGAETILARQLSPEQISRLRPEIDMLHSAYRDVRKGDSYSLCYDAAQQLTTLSLNDTKLVAVPSKDLAEAYFGIWLGAVQPIDEKLRDRLLGNSEKKLADN